MPTDTCYWKHEIPADQAFPCYDGKSTVCSHCCVEQCPKETPQWFAACARAGHPTWPSVDQGQRVSRKLVVLESYWDNRLFQTMSVKGFFESMGPLHDPPLQLAHRFVESQRGLAHYTRSPEGLLWRDPAAADAPIFYLAFHGAPSEVKSVLESIGAQELCDAFQNFGVKPNLVYFAACSVLKGRAGRQFAKKFLEASRCRALLGYTTNVNWMLSLLTDMLFLHRFYRDDDPWKNLRKIYRSVLNDFKPAEEIGWTLIENPRSFKKRR
ncbi:MAG: hypothetical protein EXR70_01430 [Deltaproteobacteria bacterium]|nr:hypothetical protein [Deltaproteobacteria bacterium]